ncbi:MAG: taurine dioxygenase [Alphaproteobacteria bacterium]|nr:taurine dioxygenase [Alphaproteobacteria bacterium]
MTAGYRTITVTPITDQIGAEIGGVDLARELSQETFAEIHRAFLDHLVVFFRDQTLTPDRQIAFARCFGPLIVDPFMKSPEGRPELMVVIKDAQERFAFGEGWHTDSTFLEKPPLGSFLYALDVPPRGGDTLFSNQYLAFETLSPGSRRMLDGMKTIHGAASYNQSITAGKFGADRTMKLRADAAMNAAMEGEVEHPAVRTHPESGRKALFVNRAYTLRFKDWTAGESQPLLNHLCAHSERPEFTCRFRWTPGTLALWDNRCALHNPINDYHGHRRVMHRVVVQGDRPF